jgi:hypothetical protein
VISLTPRAILVDSITKTTRKRGMKQTTIPEKKIELSASKIIRYALIALVVYFGTHYAFKASVRNSCDTDIQAALDCDCVSRLVVHKVTFVDKWRVMLFGTPLGEVMSDIPVTGMMACSEISIFN